MRSPATVILSAILSLFCRGCVKVEIWTACGPVDHCVGQIKKFLDLGVDHVAIRPIGDDLEEQFRIYLEELLPALGAHLKNL